MTKTTHVANATNKDIYARVGVNRINLKSIKGNFQASLKVASFKVASIDVGGGGEATYEYDILHAGFVKIAPGDFFGFNTVGDNGKVYVSILYDSIWTAENYELDNDYSVIVKEGGYLRQTQYGKIWVDNQGVRYKPA